MCTDLLVLLVVEAGGAARPVLGQLGGGAADAVARSHTPWRRPSVRRLVHRPLEHLALQHTRPTLAKQGLWKVLGRNTSSSLEQTRTFKGETRKCTKFGPSSLVVTPIWLILLKGALYWQENLKQSWSKDLQIHKELYEKTFSEKKTTKTLIMSLHWCRDFSTQRFLTWQNSTKRIQ